MYMSSQILVLLQTAKTVVYDVRRPHVILQQLFSSEKVDSKRMVIKTFGLGIEDVCIMLCKLGILTRERKCMEIAAVVVLTFVA